MPEGCQKAIGTHLTLTLTLTLTPTLTLTLTAGAHLLRPTYHARSDPADAEPADEVVVGDV